MRTSNQKGFSLVEILVAAAVMLAISGLVMTVFIMQHNELRESALQAQLHRQYENVSLAVANAVRAGSAVLKQGETYPPSGHSVDSSASIIQVYDVDGVIVAGFNASGDTLKEWVGNAWTAFEAGGGAVLIDAGSSGFVLPTTRKRVTLDLTLRVYDKGDEYVLAARKDGFTCRN